MRPVGLRQPSTMTSHQISAGIASAMTSLNVEPLFTCIAAALAPCSLPARLKLREKEVALDAEVLAVHGNASSLIE